jgi:CheY-like chemotaxis protein
MAEAFAPDIVFVDIGLPIMDGYELAAHLQQLPRITGTRLIALTGYGQDSDRSKTTAAGCHAHLVKPIDFDALDQVLVTVLPDVSARDPGIASVAARRDSSAIDTFREERRSHPPARGGDSPGR